MKVNKHPRWRERAKVEDDNPKYLVSEEELLNRVLLTKALIAHCGNQTVQFRTDKETLNITPSIARDLILEAGLRLEKRV